MVNKPHVGQKVKLSKRGYQSCHLTSEEEFEQGLLGDHADYAEYHYYIECPNCDATILKDDTNV